MVASIDVRRATVSHWKLIYDVRSKPLHPKDFKQKWQCTNDDIAELLGVTRGLVERWFFSPGAKNYKDPDENYTRRLAEIDYMWRNLADCPPHIKTAFEKVQDKNI